MWGPLDFFPKTLSDTEMRHSAFDREFLPIYAMVKNFQRILEGRSVMIRLLLFAASQRWDKSSSSQAIRSPAHRPH